MSEVQAEPKATPPQYQAKPYKIWALQFTGANHADMLAFGKTATFLSPEGELMLVGNPIPLAAGEWLIQWSNTERRGEYERFSESAFNLTWVII